MTDLGGDEGTVFDELDLDTGNRMVIVLYNEDTGEIEIENPNDLPYHEVVGLLKVGLSEWEEGSCRCFYEEDDEDDDE